MVVISKSEMVPSSPSSLPLPQFPLQQTPASAPPTNQIQNPNSIMSLTLDEIQCKSGRFFGSMSMDEFLANIWNSDENQADSPLPVPIPPTRRHESPPFNSFSVPPPICKKTVDEIWCEIHREQKKPQENDEANNESLLKRQNTLGEMTLEDFLVKAGVVQESSLSSLPFKLSSSSPPPPTPPALPVQDNMASNNRAYEAMRMGYCRQNVGGNVVAETYNNNQVFSVSQSHGLGVKDSTTGAAVVDKCEGLPESSSGNGGFSGKKRMVDGPPEVVVERRQRRMLKNRESAARSRARRQAYTVELEAGLRQLREENERLKQILAEAERKRKQEIAQRKHLTKAQKRREKFRAIRRTASMSW
ncbi:ABSCISIC ACID-INSENSITIVE 5-like protein 1 [Senna tora]|uniref:ABSCISIC ACID-INSENSITIVE 5-like protein 1 n=1 Tax=Senna tora TaxID=362788 RepID=A0A834TLR9_9FABA|nr:ABSCISIC ACID-INSENSITIVE 5-like protein 1 [Senna tora]